MATPRDWLVIGMVCALGLPVGGCMLPQPDTPLVPPGVALPGRAGTPARSAPVKAPAEVGTKADPQIDPTAGLDAGVRSDLGAVTAPALGAAPAAPPPVSALPAPSAAASAPPMVPGTGAPVPSEGKLAVSWASEAGLTKARVIDAAGAELAHLLPGTDVGVPSGTYTLEVERDGAWLSVGGTVVIEAGRHRTLVIGVADGRARIETAESRDLPAGEPSTGEGEGGSATPVAGSSASPRPL